MPLPNRDVDEGLGRCDGADFAGVGDSRVANKSSMKLASSFVYCIHVRTCHAMYK